MSEKKIIGVCLTKLQDSFRNNYLKFLHEAAKQNNFKLIVFNSIFDLFNNDVYDEGARTVYEMINYDVLDAVIVLSETFYDKEVVENIITSAREHNKPVLIIRGNHEGCSSIEVDYTEAYKKVIRHVINDHGARDTFFIAGRRDNDPDSVKRIACYKDVLEESGIPFDKQNIDYGDYWDIPTFNVIDRLVSSRSKMPDAIICANDNMAVAACIKLAECGYKVPDDVIVTGFDGVESAEYFMPRITTCKEDIKELAESSVSILKKNLFENSGPICIKESFIPFIAESCGCHDKNTIDYRKRSAELYHLYRDYESHEGHIFAWTDRVLECTDLTKLSTSMRFYILPSSYVCLRSDIIASAIGHAREKQASDNFITVYSTTADFTEGAQGKYDVEKMVPEFDDWLDDDTMCIISSIFVRDEFCGYYIAKTKYISETGHKLNRILKIMNVALSAVFSRARHNKMAKNMENLLYTDTLTGLSNLKGSVKWFEEFSAVPENHKKTLCFSIYGIPRYSFIYETYGIQEIEEAVSFVADSLRMANPENSFIARTADDEFLVINYHDDENITSRVIDNATSVFYSVIESYNSREDKDYFVEVNAGCTVVNADWSGTLRSFMKLASGEMYLNRMQNGLGEVIKEKNSSRELFNIFNLLVEKNLFKYFFQPIVDAKTGEIYAYEALMRTDSGINMSPLQVLEIAEEYSRLHDIEKATMFNIMERYAKENDKFRGRKVFINTIPGYFLNSEDCQVLREKYEQYFDNFVFELTEQNTVADNELEAIRRLCGKNSGSQIAVDDYGTGHSNIVNLLRYSPQVVKIDRFLISNINNDTNKQMFVKSTIDFARLNNIMVLAEGVETSEELKTVIEFGVDLIQGYYTARPAEEPLADLPESVKNEIVGENIRLSKFDNDLLVYNAKSGETIDLVDLATKKYAVINVDGGMTKFIGNKSTTIEMVIKTADNTQTELVFESVNIKGSTETTVQLGKNSANTITLIGYNTLNKEGISVPENSSLRIIGDGNLIINNNRNYGVGIGSGYEDPFGDITLNTNGSIKINSSGDKVIGIGGGTCGSDCAINLISGSISINSTGIDVVGIGSSAGSVSINIGQECRVDTHCIANEAVSIGSVSGAAKIVTEGMLDLLTDGENVTEIGTIFGDKCDIDIRGTVNIVGHGDSVSAIGSISGETDIKIDCDYIKIYCEGTSVCGIGSRDNKGSTYIAGGNVSVDLLSGLPSYYGSKECSCVIMGGNFYVSKDEVINAVNEAGEKLHPVYAEGNTFDKIIKTGGTEYRYRAIKHNGFDRLCVYLPDEA